MKYIDKFSNMICIHEVRENMLRGRCPRPCIVCGDLTEYIEINYEARICSEECIEEMDRRANEAFKRYMDDDDSWYEL